MTNKLLFIANWKMFGDLNSVKSVQSVINLSKKKNYKNAKIIYCPPYTLLNNFIIKTRKTNLDVGAQNCHYEINTGPFTGSISSTMIKKLGVKYVIIGHSENRSNGETNNQINKKIHSAISNNLNVIFCIGENLSEKKNKKANFILKKQIYLGLKKIKKIEKIILSIFLIFFNPKSICCFKILLVFLFFFSNRFSPMQKITFKLFKIAL